MVARNADGKFANRTFAYEFHLMDDGGNVIANTTLSAGDSTTTWNYTTDLARDTPYRWRVRATLDGAFGPWSSTSRFLTVKENRTPNPASGRLPRPDMGRGVVAQVASQRPDLARALLPGSHGGTLGVHGRASSTRCGCRTRAGATTASAATSPIRRTTSSPTTGARSLTRARPRSTSSTSCWATAAMARIPRHGSTSPTRRRRADDRPLDQPWPLRRIPGPPVTDCRALSIAGFPTARKS